MTAYIPKKGEFIYINFDPQSGHEQSGWRPGLVVSNDLFNRNTGLCMVCPITRTQREYPFHLEIPKGLPVEGVVMIDQLKSQDYRARSAKRISMAPEEIINEALSLLDACIYDE